MIMAMADSFVLKVQKNYHIKMKVHFFLCPRHCFTHAFVCPTFGYHSVTLKFMHKVRDHKRQAKFNSDFPTLSVLELYASWFAKNEKYLQDHLCHIFLSRKWGRFMDILNVLLSWHGISLYVLIVPEDTRVILGEDVEVWLDTAKDVTTQTLHEDSFEHLTQASTGATTGDWLVIL